MIREFSEDSKPTRTNKKSHVTFVFTGLLPHSERLFPDYISYLPVGVIKHPNRGNDRSKRFGERGSDGSRGINVCQGRKAHQQTACTELGQEGETLHPQTQVSGKKSELQESGEFKVLNPSLATSLL